MADAESSSPSFFKRHWEGWRTFGGKRFSFVDNYNRFIQGRHNPTDSDMEAFIALDPFHIPTVKAARETAKIVGREVLLEPFQLLDLPGNILRVHMMLSDPLVLVICLVILLDRKLQAIGYNYIDRIRVGDVFGYTLGQEAASHWLQLYRLDSMTAQVKFLEWSKSKYAATT